MRELRSIVFPLLVLSGMAGLVYETVWVRQFSGIFGSTAAAAGAVTAAFMLGMAVGGSLIGRLGDRLKDRLVVFAILEALIGLYGILSSAGFGWVEEFFYSVGGGGLGLQFTLAGVFLAVPTFLMGGTLPVLSRFVLREEKKNFGAAAGGLYAATTLGAAAGAFVAGFYLLEILGATDTLRAAGAVNLIVAATAVLARLSASKEDKAGVETKSPAGDEPAIENTEDRESTAEGPAIEKKSPAESSAMVEDSASVVSTAAAGCVLIPAFVLCGAALLGMEVIWTRLLSQFFRNSIYSFSGMLACVLLGLAAGGFAGARISGRVRSPRRTLAYIQLMAALATLATLYVFQYLGDLDRYRSLVRSFGGYETFSGLALLEATFAFCVVFPPTFLMGTTFPFMAAMNWRRPSRFGGFVGDIQLASTIGAVAGSLGMAFWLLPSEIGLFKCTAIAVCLNAFAAILLMAAQTGPAIGRHVLATLGLVAAGCVLAWLHPGELEFWKGSPRDRELLYYREDAVANVAVVRRDDGLVMKVNNTAGLGGTGGALLETRLGLMPPLLFGKPDRALCLGLGTGNTLMGLVHSGPDEIDCIELLDHVIEASRYFHVFEEEVPYDTRLNIIQGDARIWLAVEDRKYDLVLGDLFFPWQSTAGFLYTREHFERVKKRLAPGGVYCQWIPLYQMHWEDFGVIGYTFSEVFDHVTVFLASGETDYPVAGLVGSSEPFKFNPVAMQERLDIHPRKPIIDRLGLGNAMENLSLYIGDHWLFRARFPDPVVNTVDRTLVEFRAARVFERQEVLGFNHFIQLAAPGSKENVIAFLDREALQGRERSDLETEIAAYSEGMREYLGSHAYAIGERLLRSASGIPIGEDTPELRRMSEERLETALRAFETAPEHRVLRDNLERVWRSMIQKEELRIAANLMQTACVKLPDDEKFAYNWGLSYLLQEMYDEACVAFDRALDIRSDFFLARIHRGIALFCRGKRVQAREEIDRALDESGEAGRAALSRSPLTRGLVDLILEGPESAGPELEKTASRGPWAPLIVRAMQVAAEGEEGVEPPR